MWTFIGDGEPLAGIGPGPLTDEEFEARVEQYEARYSEDQRGAVQASGLYQHEGASPAGPADADEEV